ncbi:hypothetical protein BHM03_00049836 [Ensete ventricosum]|nr:hypothetical protein BHM03_00049836 [Ensete ventricosum]
MGCCLTVRRALLGVRSKWQGRTLLEWEGAVGRALLGGRDGGEGGCHRHDWAAGSSSDGGERVAIGDGAGCSDPFAAAHAAAKLTMGVAGDEWKGSEKGVNGRIDNWWSMKEKAAIVAINSDNYGRSMAVIFGAGEKAKEPEGEGSGCDGGPTNGEV